MTISPRLNTLIVKNFRSIKGQIVVPLDAQVVLVHGTNGLGKTSVLSALELALTGKVAHLATQGEDYKKYLTNLGASGGTIELVTTAPLTAQARTQGSLAINDMTFTAEPLLDSPDARFFAERCYLPQATLNRLLEIYSQQKTDTTSPLTQFVKELLGLEPLDALVDGLHAAQNVTRIRNLVPSYKAIERRKGSLDEELVKTKLSVGASETQLVARKTEARSLLTKLGHLSPAMDTAEELASLQAILQASQAESDSLASLERVRAQLSGIATAWRSLPSGAAQRDEAAKTQLSQSAAADLSAWRSSAGAMLQSILAQLQPIFPDLPGLDDGPDSTRAAAEVRAQAEADRCATILGKAAAAAMRRADVQQKIQRSSARMIELDQALSASAENTQSLASALAAIAPHVHGESCPVCDRDFSDQTAGTLGAHIANKVAALTTEAGRLQSLAAERAEIGNILSVAQRDVITADREQIAAEEQATLTVRGALMTSLAQRLKGLESEAVRGATLMARAAQAREAVSLAKRSSDLTSSLLPQIEKLISEILDVAVGSFQDVDRALTAANQNLDAKIADAEVRIKVRVQALAELDLCAKALLDIGRFAKTVGDIETRLGTVQTALAAAATSREVSKVVADNAQSVRSTIVKRVFNTSLNKVWRDLFVRLAPSEDFVPGFRLPTHNKDQVEATLETLHRSGKPSGTPGAMLSQGNLNTAALTLFLALHLSVPARMPWLVLDDPVQSMDDVHIAQFAALLRTLSKGMDRQIILAVHERALFDYLTLEMSPAFPGDSLITVEISRNFEGNTVARSNAYAFKDDNVIAA